MNYPTRDFHELTNQVDDLVDQHVGDRGRMELIYKGTRNVLPGTVSSIIEEQFVEGAIAKVTKFYASIAEKNLPVGLSGDSGAFVVRKDPYNPTRIETFSVAAVDRPRSGRSRLTLRIHIGKLPIQEQERVSHARQDANKTPHR